MSYKIENDVKIITHGDTTMEINIDDLLRTNKVLTSHQLPTTESWGETRDDFALLVILGWVIKGSSVLLMYKNKTCKAELSELAQDIICYIGTNPELEEELIQETIDFVEKRGQEVNYFTTDEISKEMSASLRDLRQQFNKFITTSPH